MAGEHLKNRREELGLELKEISSLLKIRQDYLSWIEEDCFEKLPVAVYTIGYIRCYANYLGIDPEPVISLYTGHLEEPKPTTIFPVSSYKKKIPLPYYIIPVLVIVLVILIFLMLRQSGPVSGKINAGPAVSPQQPAPVSPALTQNSTPQPVQSPVNIAKDVQSVNKNSENHSIEITASDNSWMHIKYSEQDSEQVMFRPGMTRTWQFKDKVELKLGNAGGIRIKLDGRDIGVPGNKGQVMTIVLPEDHRIIPPIR